jgi:hypothetical protein
MGGTCSKRSDPYEVKEPPYDYSEIFERVMAEAVSEEAIAACRLDLSVVFTKRYFKNHLYIGEGDVVLIQIA